MKRVPFVLVLVMTLSFGLFAAACGDDDESTSPPLEIQQKDRDQISQIATDYIAALAARDMTKALAQLPAGVPSATVTNAMNTFQSEGYQFLSVGDMTVSGQDVIVNLALKDKSGKDVTRTFEFRIDKGEWKLWSPQLKLPA